MHIIKINNALSVSYYRKNNRTYHSLIHNGYVIASGFHYMGKFIENKKYLYVEGKYGIKPVHGWLNIHNLKIYDGNTKLIKYPWNGIKTYSLEKKLNKILAL